MGFFDDIKECKSSTIIIIILSILVFHLYWTANNKEPEPMADVGNLDQIKEAVKQVYLADVEAIRNLSNVATQLQAGGLKIPGNLSTLDNISVSNKTNEGGRLRILNELKNGKPDQTNDWSIWNMTGAYGNKLSFWRYNGDGKNAGPALDLLDDGTVSIPGKVVTPNGHTFECAGRQHMSGGELLYLLHKSGVVIGKEWGGSGNLQVQGGLTVSGRDILGEIDALKGQTVKYNDFINVTTTGTGNHEGHGKYIGFCGHGACGMVNAGLTNEKGRGILRIERN